MHLALILADIRSTHNVGSLLRTCDGFGVDAVYLTGITPYPVGLPNDSRLPHIAQKLQKDIHKTALGAESSVAWHQHPDAAQIIMTLQKDGWTVYALEQHPSSIPIDSVKLTKKIALVVGNEVTGVPEALLSLCDGIVEIPMAGKKESFNVSVAGALGLYSFKTNWTKMN